MGYSNGRNNERGPTKMTALPDLSQWCICVSPYSGIQNIAAEYGTSNYFGPADYIAARQAGWSDTQIANTLKSNPWLMNPSTLQNGGQGILGQILAGQGDQIIATGLPNLPASSASRGSLTNPNPSNGAIPYAQMGVSGRGNDPSIQMNGANVDVAGNDTYTRLMQTSQAGQLAMIKEAPKQSIFGGPSASNTYKLVDTLTGDTVASGVSPTSTNGVYQFSFSNPQSGGSINTYIRADPTTGLVGAIDPSQNMTYQAGAGGGMLSGIAGMALPFLVNAIAPGLGEALAAAFPETAAAASGLSTSIGLGSTALQNAAAQAITNTAINAISGNDTNPLASPLASLGGQYVSGASGLSGIPQSAVGSAAQGAINAALTGGDVGQSALLSAAGNAAGNLAGQNAGLGAQGNNLVAQGAQAASVAALQGKDPLQSAISGGLGTLAGSTVSTGLSNLADNLSNDQPVTANLDNAQVSALQNIALPADNQQPEDNTPQLSPIDVTAQQTYDTPATSVTSTDTSGSGSQGAIPSLEPINVSVPRTVETPSATVTTSPEGTVSVGNTVTQANDGTPQLPDINVSVPQTVETPSAVVSDTTTPASTTQNPKLTQITAPSTSTTSAATAAPAANTSTFNPYWLASAPQFLENRVSATPAVNLAPLPGLGGANLGAPQSPLMSAASPAAMNQGIQNLAVINPELANKVANNEVTQSDLSDPRVAMELQQYDPALLQQFSQRGYQVPGMPFAKRGGLIQGYAQGSGVGSFDCLSQATFVKNLAPPTIQYQGGNKTPLNLGGLTQISPQMSMYGNFGHLAKGGLPRKYHEAAPEGHHPEFITGITGYYAGGRGTGQSDDIPAMLHDGDYVIDADAVAALGDGSSKAGNESLMHFMHHVPHEKSLGDNPVPAKIADGEVVLPESFVTALGGGDNKHGAKMLDHMRAELRKHKRSAPDSKIPPKAKSPLEYLKGKG